MIDEIKNIIKSVFAEDDAKAMAMVDSLIINSSTRKTDFLLVKNRITKIKDENSRGTLTFDEVQRTSNQIAASFFHFVDKLDLDDLDQFKVMQFLSSNQKRENKKNGISRQAVSFERLRTSTKPEIYEIIDFYKYNLNKGQLDDEIYFNLGLCYLYLKLYDLAIKNLEKALEIAPDNADYHYYVALAYIKGRRPYTLMPNDIRSVERFINSAIELDSKQGKYDLLSLIIKYDYYQLNGLTVPRPNIQELINSLNNKILDTNEIQRLKESIPITDSKLNQFFNQF